MVERCALSGSDLKIKFRTILLTSISGTQHKGACSRGGGPRGGYPPRHGCCVQARDRY